jgi:hypothetical protein
VNIQIKTSERDACIPVRTCQCFGGKMLPSLQGKQVAFLPSQTWRAAGQFGKLASSIRLHGVTFQETGILNQVTMSSH